ncbi:hypothetical protein TIFTF001_006839 [Ficus carica]|uniref:Uncharacterized protein n=1 Tax=Ficus carica TaxID=3494 RepID=A0AA87ZNQ6_FICCA|nr:hypothetical protein TIFTF001_006839 [Ficus carica]
MDFGEFVSAVDENEELQLGQLYFVLPLTCLNRPVPPEEMAALALKASEAFRKMRGGGGGGGGVGVGRARCCGVEGVETLEFAIKRKDVNRCRWVADTVGSGGGDSGDRQEFVSRRRRRRTGGCRVGRQRFLAELSAIEEE